MLRITPSLEIDERAIEIRFVRAGGPGGQHVNKTSSAAQLRFYIGRCDELDEATRARLRQLAGTSLNRRDEIVLTANRHREQHRNREEAQDRLARLIQRALHRPRPRKATRPGKGVKARRLSAKRQRGETKRLRDRPARDDG